MCECGEAFLFCFVFVIIAPFKKWSKILIGKLQIRAEVKVRMHILRNKLFKNDFLKAVALQGDCGPCAVQCMCYYDLA